MVCVSVHRIFIVYSKQVLGARYTSRLHTILHKLQNEKQPSVATHVAVKWVLIPPSKNIAVARTIVITPELTLYKIIRVVYTSFSALHPEAAAANSLIARSRP